VLSHLSYTPNMSSLTEAKAASARAPIREVRGRKFPAFTTRTTMAYTGAMRASKQVRRSVTLPLQVAKQVDSMAHRRRLSDNRVLVELIEEGIEAQKREAFFELAERLRAAKDPCEIKRLGGFLCEPLRQE
jgi:hypothetical protein